MKNSSATASAKCFSILGRGRLLRLCVSASVAIGSVHFTRLRTTEIPLNTPASTTLAEPFARGAQAMASASSCETVQVGSGFVCAWCSKSDKWSRRFVVAASSGAAARAAARARAARIMPRDVVGAVTRDRDWVETGYYY